MINASKLGSSGSLCLCKDRAFRLGGANHIKSILHSVEAQHRTRIFLLNKLSPIWLHCAQIKLGPPLFIPNGQLGSFGAITQLKSLVRNRRDLFDVSAAGPAAAALASLALFTAGLVFTSGSVPKVRTYSWILRTLLS